MARILSGLGVGVVPSGGGARWFAHIGALSALVAAGIEPDIVGGTSIDSVIGAWRCMKVHGDSLAAAWAAFVRSGNPVGDTPRPWSPLAEVGKV